MIGQATTRIDPFVLSQRGQIMRLGRARTTNALPAHPPGFPLPFEPPAAAPAAHPKIFTTITVGITTTLLAPIDRYRRSFLLFNPGPNPIWVGAENVGPTTGLCIQAGERLSDDVSNDAWYGIVYGQTPQSVIIVSTR